MATVHIPATKTTLKETEVIRTHLADFGISYERWDADELRVAEDAEDHEILNAYSAEIDKLKEEGGYVTADVINIVPTTPGLDEMLSKFNKEHWHDEDEVRFIVKGHGLFHIAPKNGDVLSIEMEAGDLIRVPRGTKHWFNLCEDMTVRAIRLFEDPQGWTPHYTESELESNFEPLCFGTDYIEKGVSQ